MTDRARNRDFEMRLDTLGDRLMQDIDTAVTRSEATTDEVREGLIHWFGSDVFDAYADWLEGDD